MKACNLVNVLCPVCGGGEYKALFDTRDYVFSCTDDIFRVNRCLKCGCGYLSPRPSKEDIPIYYPEAVSYTHLVVYKRQFQAGQGAAGSSQRGRILTYGLKAFRLSPNPPPYLCRACEMVENRQNVRDFTRPSSGKVYPDDLVRIQCPIHYPRYWAESL